MKFVPDKDIYDIPSLLRIIESLPAVKQKEIADFLNEELESDIPIHSGLNLIVDNTPI